MTATLDKKNLHNWQTIDINTQMPLLGLLDVSTRAIHSVAHLVLYRTISTIIVKTLMNN